MYRRHKGVNEILALVEDDMKGLVVCNGASISPNVQGANSAAGGLNWHQSILVQKNARCGFPKKCGSVVKKKTLKFASTSA